MENILAVDIGTTSAKALVVNDRGEVLTRSQEFYPTRHPQLDFSEQDPHEIFNAVKRIIREAALHVEGKVHAVSFSSAMHSLVLVNERGEAISPLMTWADLRSRQEANDLKNANGHSIYAETGTPIHPMSPLCKLMWLKKNQSELFNRAARFVGIKEYIWYQFFRKFAIDHSIASATGLFNAATLTWSPLAMEQAGVTAAKLSAPCSVFMVYTNPDSFHAKDIGLAANIPWVIGASDGCLAHLGSGAMDAGTLSLTVGTSGAVRRLAGKPGPDPQGRLFYYLLDDKGFIEGGATNNGAVVLQWYSEKFLKQPVDIRSFGERSGPVAPGSDGLVFLPYLQGERAPIFDPESAGVFFGIREHHTVEHFMRAMLEGVGYALYSIAGIMPDHDQRCERIVASGGLVQSPEWVQIMSDIFGKEVHVRGSDDASALGAAIIGFSALKKIAHFHHPPEKVYYPDRMVHGRYQEYFRIYQDLYPRLSESFHSLRKLTNP